MTEKKDTSPMVKTRRIKRQVRIQEENIPPSSLFDTTVEYPSDELPEWFQPLQPVIEDETFTSMDINLGDKVHYHVTLVDSTEQSVKDEKRKRALAEITRIADGAGFYD